MQNHSRLLRLQLQAANNLLCHHAEIHLLLLDFELAYIRARHKENIFDDRDKLLDALLGEGEILVLLKIQIAHMSMQNQVDKAMHRVQRRTQFV